MKASSRKALAKLAWLVFILTSFAALSMMPRGKAAELDTIAYIDTWPPGRTGVGQAIDIKMRVEPPPPANDAFQGLTVNIIAPGGPLGSLGPFESSPNGTLVIQYVPSEVGVYSAQLIFPAQYVSTGDSTGDNYNSSENVTTFISQPEPVDTEVTVAILTVDPEPASVNQAVEIGVTFSPPPGTDVFHDFTVTILRNGIPVADLGPYDSSSTGTYNLSYTPTESGNYSAYVNYPGEWLGDTYYYQNVTNWTTFSVDDSPEVDTTTYVHTWPPDYIGVGQTLVIGMEVRPYPPTSIDVFHNLMLNIINPDGTEEILGPYDSDPAGSRFIDYVPDIVGEYSVQLSYSGEDFSTGDYYTESVSNVTTFMVWPEPVDIEYTVVDVTINPDPVGVNQEVEIGVSFSPPPPADTDVFHDFEVVISNGLVSVRGPYDSSTAGTYNLSFTPILTGNYSAYVYYPGEWLSNTYYYPTASNSTTFIVQNDPVKVQLDIGVSGSGTTNPAPGIQVYDPGELAAVTARADDGWYFDRWLVNGMDISSSSQTYGETIFANKTLTAVFRENPPVDQTVYSLTIRVVGSGSTNPNAGVRSYPQDTVVAVNAVPASGWNFSGWSLDGASVGVNPIYSIIMNADHVLTAIFSQVPQPGNDPPVATIVSVEPKSTKEYAVQGENVVFTGYGSDPDGEVVGYRWTSSIDGLLSNYKEFSTSQLSVGAHTIYFEVQDNNGVWSIAVSQTLMVEEQGSVDEPVVLSVVLTVTGVGFAASAGVATFFYFHGRPPSSIKVEAKLQRELKEETRKEKNEEEDEKREIEKGNPYLQVKLASPARIMGAKTYKTRIKIKNVGPRQAEGITVTNTCTPDLILVRNQVPIPTLQPLKEVKRFFSFRTNEQIRKGVYINRIDVTSKNALSRVKKCHARAVKIGVLLDDKSKEYAKQFEGWLKEKDYSFDELENADKLVPGLLQYDLLVLPPELELPQKWIRNISAFVRNGQSLWVIDHVLTGEQELLAKMLGYSKMQCKPFECKENIIKLCAGNVITEEFGIGEKIHVGKCWGNACISETTGTLLAEQYNLETGADAIPAITFNECGKGKVIHFNFHAEEHVTPLNQIFEKTFDFLLS